MGATDVTQRRFLSESKSGVSPTSGDSSLLATPLSLFLVPRPSACWENRRPDGCTGMAFFGGISAALLGASPAIDEHFTFPTAPSKGVLPLELANPSVAHSVRNLLFWEPSSSPAFLLFWEPSSPAFLFPLNRADITLGSLATPTLDTGDTELTASTLPTLLSENETSAPPTPLASDNDGTEGLTVPPEHFGLTTDLDGPGAS